MSGPSAFAAAPDGAAAPGSGHDARLAEAEKFFASGAIPHLRIEVAATNLAHLRSNARAYVRATVREGDKVYTDVGLHLKGAAGSFRPVDDSKPALTLNFDKFQKHQNFHGIDKLALNNSVQDSSYMTEAICSELFLAAGVPTPRTTHARVELNGRDLELYVLKEGFDKTFLRRHFKNVTGNLYDGGFLNDITSPLERTSGEGDVPNRADLKAVAAAAREPNLTKRMERLEQVLDVDRFLSFSVLEMFTWHWDGYTLKKNNYRVYHDPDSKKVIFFPHGMDQMFWDPNQRVIPARGQAEGLVAHALLEIPEGEHRYRERAAVLATNVFTIERLTNHIAQLRSRIRPALAAISEDRARDFDRSATTLRNAVLLRIQRVRQEVSDPEPEPQPLPLSPAGEGRLVKWYPLDLRGTGILDQGTATGGVRTLHIAAGPDGRCTASWRARVLLPAGQYLFMGRLRTAGVVKLEKDVATKGTGAGIRQSSARQPRQHGFVGDNDWQAVEYEFTVPDENMEVRLLCELRAEKGDAWFDLASLKVKRKQTTPGSVPPPPK